MSPASLMSYSSSYLEVTSKVSPVTQDSFVQITS